MGSLLDKLGTRSTSIASKSSLRFPSACFVLIKILAVVVLAVLIAHLHLYLTSDRIHGALKDRPNSLWSPLTRHTGEDGSPPFDYLRRVAYRYKEQAEPEDFNPRRLPDTSQYFACQKKIALVGWWDDAVEPLKTFMEAVESISDCEVYTFGTLNTIEQPKKDPLLLAHQLRGQDIVLWWNWGGPVERMEQARKAFPEQTWVLLNWDDPSSLMVAGDMHQRKHLFDVVFSSGTAALPIYMQAGVLEAHAFVPMVDNTHYPDPQPDYETDVAFIGTEPHSHPGAWCNRTAILEALAADAQQTGMKLAIYGTERLGAAFPRFYKGEIPYEINRKVWASAKISINFHAFSGFGGWYANARNTEILGSGGLLVVDRTVEGPLRDGQECVFWRSHEPREVVAQVHQILNKYADYEPIRERGYRFAQLHFNATVYATRILEAVSRVRGGLI